MTFSLKKHEEENKRKVKLETCEGGGIFHKTDKGFNL